MAHIESWTLRGPFMNMITKFHADCFLHGELSGHLLVEDCKNAITSPLVEFDPIAGTATTLSGTHYTLGEKSLKYEEFLAEHNEEVRSGKA